MQHSTTTKKQQQARLSHRKIIWQRTREAFGGCFRKAKKTANNNYDENTNNSFLENLPTKHTKLPTDSFRYYTNNNDVSIKREQFMEQTQKNQSVISFLNQADLAYANLHHRTDEFDHDDDDEMLMDSLSSVFMEYSVLQGGVTGVTTTTVTGSQSHRRQSQPQQHQQQQQRVVQEDCGENEEPKSFISVLTTDTTFDDSSSSSSSSDASSEYSSSCDCHQYQTRSSLSPEIQQGVSVLTLTDESVYFDESIDINDGGDGDGGGGGTKSRRSSRMLQI